MAIRSEDPQSIPAILIVRDRVSTLTALVETLKRVGQRTLVLIDNASTYPPLLQYLSEVQGVEVVRTGKNGGPSSPWTSGVVDRYAGRAFIVTDPDVVPDTTCPNDFVTTLFEALRSADDRIAKVGMGLRIDDLPRNTLTDRIRSVEAPAWHYPVGKGSRGERWYRAPTHTTFAIYRPGSAYGVGDTAALRLGVPYILRCAPWYADLEALSEEERYYCEHADGYVPRREQDRRHPRLRGARGGVP